MCNLLYHVDTNKWNTLQCLNMSFADLEHGMHCLKKNNSLLFPTLTVIILIMGNAGVWTEWKTPEIRPVEQIIMYFFFSKSWTSTGLWLIRLTLEFHGCTFDMKKPENGAWRRQFSNHRLRWVESIVVFFLTDNESYWAHGIFLPYMPWYGLRQFWFLRLSWDFNDKFLVFLKWSSKFFIFRRKFYSWTLRLNPHCMHGKMKS